MRLMTKALITATMLAGTAASAQTTLRSALDGNAPPFAMPKMDGSLEGITVDMTKEIASRLGAEVTIDGMAFSALIPALQAGTYDFLSVPFFPTEERGNAFLLTEGIWAIMNTFIVREGSNVATLDDLKGKVVAVDQGTADEKWLRDLEGEYGWTVEAYGSLNDAAQAVQAGRADASLTTDASALYISSKSPALGVADVRIDTGKYLVHPVSRDKPELWKAIEEAIECIKADGTAAEIYAKWLGAPPAEGSLTVTPQPGYGAEGYPGYEADEHELTCG